MELHKIIDINGNQTVLVDKNYNQHFASFKNIFHPKKIRITDEMPLKIGDIVQLKNSSYYELTLSRLYPTEFFINPEYPHKFLLIRAMPTSRFNFFLCVLIRLIEISLIKKDPSFFYIIKQHLPAISTYLADWIIKLIQTSTASSQMRDIFNSYSTLEAFANQISFAFEGNLIKLAQLLNLNLSIINSLNFEKQVTNPQGQVKIYLFEDKEELHILYKRKDLSYMDDQMVLLISTMSVKNNYPDNLAAYTALKVDNFSENEYGDNELNEHFFMIENDFEEEEGFVENEEKKIAVLNQSEVPYACVECGKYSQHFRIDCKHYCEECTFHMVRNGLDKCPKCNISITQKQISAMRSCLKLCEGCYRILSYAKGFPRQIYHYTLCNTCTDTFSTFQFLEAKPNSYQNPTMKTCRSCKSYYNSGGFLEYNKLCFCNLCETCQVGKSTLSCGLCNSDFNPSVLTYLQQLSLKSLTNNKRCIICFKETLSPIEMFSCGQIYCKTCFESVTALHWKNNSFEKLVKCFDKDCEIAISLPQLRSLYPKALWTKIHYLKLSYYESELICPICEIYFSLNINLYRLCLFGNRGFIVCEQCITFNENTLKCNEAYIESNLKELESINPYEIVQCPKCRLPAPKNPYSLEELCTNLECGTLFCGECCCLLSPVMNHGVHYHRSSCILWSESKNIAGSMYSKSCSECSLQGELCYPPANLKIPSRVNADEVS